MVLASADPAPGYHLRYPWDAEIWPPGETMSVPVLYSGRPEGAPVDRAEVRRFVQEALDVWAGIPSAHIRWEVGPFITEAEARDRPGGTFPHCMGSIHTTIGRRPDVPMIR